MNDRPEETVKAILEEVLVLRAQTGDEGALGELCARYSTRLRYYLAQLLGANHEVDDLLQDTWLEVCRKIGWLRIPRAFRNWLYRIARDRAFRELRRLRRAPVPVTGEQLEEAGAEREGEEAFAAEDVARVPACLERLSPEHRDVILLRFLENMSYEEIAEATRCQLGTVRSRIHYAKRALRREMERMDRP